MSFFESPTQIDIPHETRIKSQSKRVSRSVDLICFDEHDISTSSDDLKRSRGKILDPNHNASTGDTMCTPRCFCSKNKMRLSDACDLTWC